MADDSSERFVLLNYLADEFAARYRRGEHPSLQEYIDRHPELADDIREFFPTLVEMEQVKDDRQAPVEQPASHTLPSPERLGDSLTAGRRVPARSTPPWTSPRFVDTQLRVYNHPGRSSNGTIATHLRP